MLLDSAAVSDVADAVEPSAPMAVVVLLALGLYSKSQEATQVLLLKFVVLGESAVLLAAAVSAVEGEEELAVAKTFLR